MDDSSGSSGPLKKKQKKMISSSEGQAAVYETMNESDPDSCQLIGTTGEFDSEQELPEKGTDNNYSQIQSQGLLEERERKRKRDKKN